MSEPLVADEELGMELRHTPIDRNSAKYLKAENARLRDMLEGLMDNDGRTVVLIRIGATKKSPTITLTHSDQLAEDAMGKLVGEAMFNVFRMIVAEGEAAEVRQRDD